MTEKTCFCAKKHVFFTQKHVFGPKKEVKIIFFENLTNLKNISCYSNEEDKWRKSKLFFDKKNELKIVLEGKFTTERGRINCSLRENDGSWRWLGIQFVVSNL